MEEKNTQLKIYVYLSCAEDKAVYTAQPDVNKNELQAITIIGKNRILVVWNEKNKVQIDWILIKIF